MSGGEGHALLVDRGNLKKRRRVNRLIEVSSTLAALLAVVVLLIVVGSVALKGIGALSLHFLTTPTALFDEAGGGISNAIVGSAVMVGLAALMAIPTGLLIAVYTTEFAPARIAHAVRFVLDILNGVPTIITGIFIYGLIVEPQHHQSAFAASVALAIIMLPIVARTAQEVLGLVPGTLKEAAHALGIARWRATVRITVPTAAGGLITGSLLAVARVAGETAPLILLSAIFAQGVGVDPSQALASIPIFIFQASESPSPEAHTQAWAAALVLIAFVLVLNVLARAIFARSRRRMGV
ncbi:MAG TPA: phosphate ABC transporter permease PstA [Solirubrobacterales bacterium]|nr:phosphate ABC transporter permease PstA [Solirubrobacterales bacterium]